MLSKLTLLDKVFVGLLLVIFGGIVLHAPLSVGFGTLFPGYDLVIKSWKEILIGVATVFGAIVLTKRKQWGVFKQPLLLLILGYVGLHLALLAFMNQGPEVALAGLLIDLRFVVYFVLVYVAIRLYPNLRKPFLQIFAVGALTVAMFSILQVTVLPKDVLTKIGYGETTIQPYLYVDQNPDYVRINGTMRGPNSLGAYAVIVLALLTAFLIAGRKLLDKKQSLVVAIIGAGGLVALWFSYSRSALLAFAAAIGLVVIITVGKKIPKWLWASVAIVLIVGGVGLYFARDSSFVNNVILHDDPTTGAKVTSNQGHADSVEYGIDRMINQPLGGGIGSTGSASLLGDSPLIIENQYLFIAHETGWLGLILFLIIFVKILVELWRRRKDWLALGAFTSGIGLALIALLLPTWADDTVAIIWWGLAALALGGSYGTLDKKTKRTA